jgi:hypothetical protein
MNDFRTYIDKHTVSCLKLHGAVTVTAAKGFDMVALAKKLFGWTGIQLTDKPLPEPEPVNAQARPMTGFFASLTAEQKKKALEYRGEESHGDQAYLRA